MTEDTVHALWACLSLGPVWEQQREWEFRETKPFGTFKELVEYIVEKGKDLALFAMTVWSVWHRRNAIRTNQNLFPVQQIHQLVRSEFVHSVLPSPPNQTTPNPPSPLCKPPPWLDIKVNFDGACFQDQNLAGAAAVIRDRNGLILASMANMYPLPPSIVAVEIIAAIKALKLAMELGHNSIILEGD